MKQKKNSNAGFIRSALSENGVPSSKRLLGAVVLLVCLACLVYLVITEGGTSVVEGIMQTFITVACVLLGLGVGTKIASTIVEGRKGEKQSEEQEESNETEMLGD